MELVLVKLFLERELIVSDVVLYIMHFYLPLRNAEIEKLLIQETKKSINVSNFRKMIIDLINHKHLILDARIQDKRLEEILLILEKWHSYPGFPTGLNGFGLKAYQYDKLMLMRLLTLFSFLHLVPSVQIPSLLEQANSEMKQKKSWYSIRQHIPMMRLVQYCLTEKLEEPLLEWMVVWPQKKFNIVHEFRHTYCSQQTEFYNYLVEKQKSPEMLEKRANFDKFGYYY